MSFIVNSQGSNEAGGRLLLTAQLFLHRIFEGNALRIVLIKPSLSSLFAGEHLEMVDITRKGIGIDVDPDGIHRITLK
jgi:hypothetical protein